MDAPRYAIDRIDEAVATGELEPRTGTGKPIPNLTRDPDWWVRAFLDRERRAERFLEIGTYRAEAVAAAVSTEHLADARATIATLNEAIDRWNRDTTEDFFVEPVSEIWLISERAKAPGC